MKRDHGTHNKKVCDYLNLKCAEKFNDWIVTTSFYSSIHFIDHALFPCEYEGKILKNINEAHNIVRQASKHQTRAILLQKLMPKHKGEYEFLIEQSQNARYTNYIVNEVITQRAVRYLEEIMKSYDKDKSQISK